MAITRQAYEWRGLVPRDVDPDGVISTGPDYVIGQPILGSFEETIKPPAAQPKPWQQYVVPDIERGHPIEIMWGQKGNNLKTSAEFIGFSFLLSFTLSIKCLVNSTSIPTLPHNLSRYFST